MAQDHLETPTVEVVDGRLRRAAIVVLCLIAAKPALCQDISCGAPPPAEPHRIKGGESFPPLPLPVTPLRRTERKRPPAPPVLIAKLAYGQKRSVQGAGGAVNTYLDWKSDPADAANLLNFACPKLGIRYRPQVIAPKEFSWNPSEIPIVYVTGHQGFAPPAAVLQQLAEFAQAGGSVIGDACCGSAAFADSFTESIKTAFPYRRLAPLPPEHPLFHSFFDIAEVTYMEGSKPVKKGPPEILAVEIGCRAAVLLSRYDLSCGWDGHIHDSGARITPEDAVRLGTNMLAYVLNNQSLGRFLAYMKTYYEENVQAGADAFNFGQLIHQGDWDPDPSAVANLLKALNSNTAVNARFARSCISAETGDLSDTPFLYMTGHHDFTFSARELSNLSVFFGRGGFLLADACCGRKAFDVAFRREIARVLPGRQFEKIPADDPLYSSLYRIENVGHALQTQPTAPVLFGVKVDGFYAVVYSPEDIGNGWEGEEHPGVGEIVPEDSLKLGMNAIMYALTH